MVCAAVAVTAAARAPTVSASSRGDTRGSSSSSSVHESLWGTPVVWDEDPEPLHRYVPVSDTTSYNSNDMMNTASSLLMRGGTRMDVYQEDYQYDSGEEEYPIVEDLDDDSDDDSVTAVHHHPPTKNTKKSKKKKRSSSLKKKHRSQDPEEGGSSSSEPLSSKTKKTTKPASSSSSHPISDSPVVEEILQHEDYYDILGLPRGEGNISAIKKAYRRRAVQTHPDKTGGDRRAFDKLAEAYDALLDDDKRALYDRYGKAGLDPTNGLAAGAGAGRGGMASAEDLFRSFFGGGPSQQQQQQARNRNRTLRYQLEVSLEEMYKGKTRKVTVEAPPRQQQRNMFFDSPTQERRKKKTVEVPIPRGGHPGQRIVLSGEMDFDAQDGNGGGGPPGDLIFQLHPRPHKTFSRKGHDLALEVKISFQEAVCGCKRTITHLDGRSITVESAKRQIPKERVDRFDNNAASVYQSKVVEDGMGEASSEAASNIYIQTGDVQVLKGQGMPKNAQGTEFGDLYVQYSVELPNSAAGAQSLTPSERIELGRLLEKLDGDGRKGNGKKTTRFPIPGNLSNIKSSSASPSFTLEPASLMDFGRASGPVQQPVDDHDDHHQQEDDHQQHFPFGNSGAQRQFFFSSSGSSPFFGQETNFEDDPNVQCSQM